MANEQPKPEWREIPSGLNRYGADIPEVNILADNGNPEDAALIAELEKGKHPDDPNEIPDPVFRDGLHDTLLENYE